MNKRKFYIVDEKFRQTTGDIELPIRSTKNSAGYDIKIPCDVKIFPQQNVLIWTDIKVNMNDNDVFELYIRSSVGINKRLRLGNVTGIIDSDYFSNIDNDGNIGVCLYNYGAQTVELKKGEKICQGIFKNYLTTVDDFCQEVRIGGIGSTGLK